MECLSKSGNLTSITKLLSYLQSTFEFCPSPNLVLHTIHYPGSHTAFSCVSLVSFSLEYFLGLLCLLWPWRFGNVQASYFVESFHLGLSSVFSCLGSGSYLAILRFSFKTILFSEEDLKKNSGCIQWFCVKWHFWFSSVSFSSSRPCLSVPGVVYTAAHHIEPPSAGRHFTPAEC